MYFIRYFFLLIIYVSYCDETCECFKSCLSGPPKKNKGRNLSREPSVQIPSTFGARAEKIDQRATYTYALPLLNCLVINGQPYTLVNLEILIRSSPQVNRESLLGVILCCDHRSEVRSFRFENIRDIARIRAFNIVLTRK